MIFRLDDISGNSDVLNVGVISGHLIELGHTVIWGVSPLVDTEAERGRVFRKELSAGSEIWPFYQMNKCYIPEKTDPRIILASHGLVHCDHRLLSKDAQEMSILTSCSLVRTNRFIPPFNKWNSDTEEICRKYGIKLEKYEDGWKSAEHNKFDPYHMLWYFHPYAMNYRKLVKWLK